jgi:hypothetical protein
VKELEEVVMFVKSLTIVLIIFIDCLVSREGGVKSCFYKGKECGEASYVGGAS